MTKTQEHQWLSQQLGMSPKAYVAWGLSLVRSQKELPTQVGVGGLARGDSITSLPPLPPKKTKRDKHIASWVRGGKIYHLYERPDGSEYDLEMGSDPLLKRPC